MRKLILFFCIIFLNVTYCNGTCYALGDGSSCSTDMPEAAGLVNFQGERGGSLTATAGFENIIKKPLANHEEAVSARIEGNQYLAGLGYRIANSFEPYLRFGMSKLDIFWTENSQLIEMNGENDLALGAGLKILAFKAKLTSLARLKLNLDGQIRYTEPKIDKVKIAGASRSVTAEEFRVLETRGAATIGLEISLKNLLGEEVFEEGEVNFYLMPYAGILYSDSLVRAEFNYNDTIYSLTETNDKNNLHLIAGVDLVAPKYVVMNLETQIFDGESISGGVTVKF